MLRDSLLVGPSSRFLETAWFSGFLLFEIFDFGFHWPAQSPSPRCQMAAKRKHVCAQQVPCVPQRLGLPQRGDAAATQNPRTNGFELLPSKQP